VAVFVINEWLWADLAASNGLQAQREAFRMIERLASSDHKVVIVEGSRFDQKAWGLCKSDNTIAQTIAGIYVSSIRQNSDRCLILRAEDVTTLPDDLASTTKADDHYLLQAQMTATGAILVTTDTPLREAACKAGLNCLSREEFLKAYF
jgi:hypothetical protein